MARFERGPRGRYLTPLVAMMVSGTVVLAAPAAVHGAEADQLVLTNGSGVPTNRFGSSEMVTVTGTWPFPAQIPVIENDDWSATPNAGFDGADSFTYDVSDGRGGSGTGTVSVSVDADPNRAPLAFNRSYSAYRNEPVTVTLLAWDPDGDAVTYRVTSGPAHGTLADGCADAERTCTYQANPGFDETDTFTYVANDGEFDSAEATVTIAVVNRPPEAVGDVLFTPFETEGSVNVLDNDSDPDGNELVVTAATQGANGSVSCTPGGTCTYRPDQGFVGLDTFAYEVSDVYGGTDSGEVFVVVESGLQFPADVVFVIDESGSMGSDIADVKANVATIAAFLSGGGLDARLGLIGYGASASSGHSPNGYGPHIHSVLAEPDDFDRALDELVATGGIEPALDAAVASVSDAMGFRPEAGVCVVLITDERSNGDASTTTDALAALRERDATFFAVGTSSMEILTLADGTGGEVFSISSFRTDPVPVLGALLQRCAGSIVEGINLLPPSAEKEVGGFHTVTGVVRDSLAAPVSGIQVDFEVVSGPHAGLVGSSVTDGRGEADFSYVGSAEGTDTIRATFVDSATQDAKTATATTTWTLNEPAQADLSVTQSDAPDPVVAGESLTYTVTVANVGPDEATNVIVTDSLPPGVTLVATTDCGEDPAGVPTCSLGAIPPGGSSSFTIHVSVGSATLGLLTNTVSVTSDVIDPDASNNSATEDTTVLAPPIADAGGPYRGTEGSALTLDGSGSLDPDGGVLGFEWDLDGDGEFDDATGANPTLVLADGPATIEVTVRVTDPDGLSDEATAQVSVTNAAPQLSASSTGQSVQYSDALDLVRITAVDIAADRPDRLALTHSINSGNFVAGLPDGVTISEPTCGQVAGECHWELDGVAAVPAGIYAVRLSVEDQDGARSDPVDIMLTVTPEAARVGFDGDNPWAVQADEPGVAGLVEVAVLVVENDTPNDVLGDDQLAGDIARADVLVSLVPVGPGPTVDAMEPCTSLTAPGQTDPESDHDYDILVVRCAFADVPVNAYTVMVTVDGGGFYAGSGADVVSVSDPSVGHATGGGWFYWPGTGDDDMGYPGDRTNFGFTVSYTKNGENLRGSLTMIRHMPDGTLYRVKSNALDSLAVGEDPAVPMGWAVFSGQATYQDPAMPDPEGDHTIVVYVEDLDEPGRDADGFWIQMRDKGGSVIGESSMQWDAATHPARLAGGNIVVRHTPNTTKAAAA